MKSQVINLKLVHKYFSDLRKWIIAVVSLFAVAFWAGQHSQNMWGRYTLIPGCFFILFMLNSRYYLLWYRAVNDVRKGKVIEADVIVNKIYLDKHFNFFNKGGAPVGDMHFLLEDTNGNRYRLCINRWTFPLDDDFAGVQIRVQYLITSRIVASMIELPISKRERSAQCASLKFRRELSCYFTINNKCS